MNQDKPKKGRNGSLLLDEETCTLIKENTTPAERNDYAYRHKVTLPALNSWLRGVNRVPKHKTDLVQKLKKLAKKNKASKDELD